MNSHRLNSTERTIIHYLEERSVSSPSKTAFIFIGEEGSEEHSMTYQELWMEVIALSNTLTQNNLFNKPVVLLYESLPRFIVAFLACQFLGIIAVPAPFYKGKRHLARVNAIHQNAGAIAVFTEGFCLNSLKQQMISMEGFKEVDIIATDLLQDRTVYPSVAQQVSNQISFLQYTSGSTGRPKGVIVSNTNLLANQEAIRRTFGCEENSVIFSWLPFHHDMGLVGNILHTIYCGSTCILMRPAHFIQKPQRWLEGITKYGVTHSGGPNFAYDTCVEKYNHDEIVNLDLSSWKVAYNGSEKVRPATLENFSKHFAKAGFNVGSFYPCYGLAEATLLVTGSRQTTLPVSIIHAIELEKEGCATQTNGLSVQQSPLMSCGSVVEGTTLKIVNIETGTVCNELQTGEVCITGAGITAGYWNSPNDIFISIGDKRFLRTGDLGFLYKNELFINGRVKELLIFRGMNYYPYDIEQAISKCHTSIIDNGVAIFNLHGEEEKIVVLAELKRNSVNGDNVESVLSSIDNTVTGNTGIIPYDIVLTTPMAIPRTTSGKLQRIKCRKEYLHNKISVIASKLGYVSRSIHTSSDSQLLENARMNKGFHAISKYLADIISSRIGSDISLVESEEVELADLGIDSIKAMELVNKINSDLDINMNVTTLFHDQNFHSFVRSIEHLLWLKTGSSLENEIVI